MITDEERNSIIDAAVEKALLMIPEVVGNMMTNHVTMAKINKEFYAKHPEFRDKKDIVVSVIEMIEGQDPTIDYDEILKRAVPEIQKRIEITASLDTTTVTTNADRKIKEFQPTFDPNGEI